MNEPAEGETIVSRPGDAGRQAFPGGAAYGRGQASRASQEVQLNIVSEEFAKQMNLTARDYPAGVDEFAVSGLTAINSELVRPPRVKESRVSFGVQADAQHRGQRQTGRQQSHLG